MSKTGDDKTSGSTNSSTVDVMSPFFIPPSDHPGQTFVGELLRDDNYADWANEMSNALFTKNKNGFVDGSISIPENEKSLEFGLWKRCNAMVRGWLNSAMEKEIRSSVKYAQTAKEIWDDLKERFGKESAPRAYEIRRAITQTKQGDLSVSAYYTNLRSLWEEFHAMTPVPRCVCGRCSCEISKQFQTIREKERLYEFLMGLDESFGTIKTHILSTKPTPSISFAYHLVAEDEAQRNITTARRPGSEAAAFQFQTQHVGGERKEPPRCSYCHRLYHTKEQCYELNDYPKPGEKGKTGDKKSKVKNGGQGTQKL